MNSGNGKVIITTLFPKSSSSSSNSANHTAITELATNIASTTATLNGTVNPKGESVYYQFFYRKESESSKSDQATSYIFAGSGSSDVSVSAQITGLSPGTKYVYQLYAYSYTTSKEVNGELKSFTTLASSSSSSSVSYGISETRPYFETGQEPSDIVGVKYKFKIANNNGQSMKILFGGSRLSGTSTDTYYLERNIYNSKVSYSDPVCVSGWEKLNVMTIGQSTLRIAVPDYIKKGKTGLKTGNVSYFPRITYDIDNIADLTKTDVISQDNLNNQEGTIETLRGDIISDKSGWKCNNQNLDSDIYRQWNIKTTIGASTYQTSIALPENGAKYLTPYELINFRTEFFQNTGLFKVYLWDFQFERESKATWEPLTKWKVSDYDGNTANYGIRKTIYNGNDAIEISNDNSVKFLAKNSTFELPSSFSSSSSSSSSSVASNLSAGLVSHWKLDETSGTTASDSSGTNNGTVNGATWTEGKVNNGLSFNGTTNRVTTNSNLNITGEITVSAWIYPTAAPNGLGRIVATTYDYDATPNLVRGWTLGNNFGSQDIFRFMIYDSSGNTVNAYKNGFFANNLNKWTHIAGTFSPSQYIKLYIDGTLVHTNTTNIPSNISYKDGTSLTLGSRAESASQGNWNGKIDDVRIYNRALSSAEINDISASSSPSSSSSSSVANSLSSGLVAQYRFNDGNANDSYGNKNGEVFGAISTQGKESGALSFNGTTDYVSVPRMNYNDITVSAWFYRDLDLSQDSIFGGWYWTSNPSLREGFDLKFNATSNQMVFVVETIGATTTEKSSYYTLSPSVGAWHHVVGTYDSVSGAQKLYVDEILRDTDYHPAGATIKPLAQYADMRIGHSRVNNAYFGGKIDEVKIYNRALTQQEISILYSMPGISCDTSGSCALGYRIKWLNQIGAVLESIGQTIKQSFTIKKQR